MSKNSPDMLIRAVNFSDSGITTDGKKLSKESFIDNVINNSEFKKRLEYGLILGLFTHQGRNELDLDRSEIPYDDLVAKHKDLANVARTCKILKDSKGESAYLELDLLNTEAAERIKDRMKNGLYVGVSMATDCDYEPSKGLYHIIELKGIDYTLDPAFNYSGVVRKNFSNSNDEKYSSTQFKRMSVNFSSSMIYSQGINFSIKDYIREYSKPIYLVLQYRILELIRYAKTLKPEEFLAKKKYIKMYINDIIYNYLAEAFKLPGKLNLNLGLRLSRFIKNARVISLFNQKFNIVKEIVRRSSKGHIPYPAQDMLAGILDDLFEELWTYISEKSKVSFIETADNAESFMKGIK